MSNGTASRAPRRRPARAACAPIPRHRTTNTPSANSGVARAANTNPSASATGTAISAARRADRGVLRSTVLSGRLPASLPSRRRQPAASTHQQDQRRRPARSRSPRSPAGSGRTRSPPSRQSAGTRQAVPNAAPTDGSPRSRPSQLARRPRLKLSARTSRAGRVEREPHARRGRRGSRCPRDDGTRPGRSAPAAAPGERRRSRYGASTPGSALEPRLAGRQRRRGVAARERAAGGPASRSSSVASSARADAAPPTAHVERAAAGVDRPGAAHLRPRHARAADLGDPDRAPLPRRRRACPARTRRAGSRAGSAAPRSGCGSRTTPSGADVERRRGCRSPTTRTCVGRRTPGTGSSVSAEIVAGRGVPLQPRRARARPLRRSTAAAVPSKALEARKPGRPWKRADDVNGPRTPASRSSAESGASSGDARPAVDVPRARGRRRERRASRPRLARRRGRARAPRSPSRARASRRNGSSPVVRWNRYVRLCRDVRAGQRALGQHRRPQRLGRACTPGIRSSRMPAGGRRSPLRCVGRRSGRAAASTPLQPDRQPVPARVHRKRRPVDLDRGHRRAGGRCTAAAGASPTSRGAVEVDLEHVAVVRSARGRPASASPRRRRAPRTAGAPGTAGSRARTARAPPAMPVVDRDGLRVRPRGNGFSTAASTDGSSSAASTGPAFCASRDGTSIAAPVGVGDHDLAAPADLLRP